MNGDTTIRDKLILLNKALHGVWISYKNNLPNIFLLAHPVGTVLGNVNYSDYLMVIQNVTVNSIPAKDNSLPGEYGQTFGKGLFLSSGAKIIGCEKIGDFVSIGVNVCVHKQAIPSNHIVYRDQQGILCIKKHDTKKIIEKYFHIE